MNLCWQGILAMASYVASKLLYLIPPILMCRVVLLLQHTAQYKVVTPYSSLYHGYLVVLFFVSVFHHFCFLAHRNWKDVKLHCKDAGEVQSVWCLCIIKEY